MRRVNMLGHIVHKHDKSPSQAQALIDGSPVEDEARLQEENPSVAELQERLSRAEARTIDDFTPKQKAEFVIGWARGLSPEDKAVFAEHVGIPIAGAEAAESDAEPGVIDGKTEKTGYKYLEALNISIRE
jgi:DNA-directed RNA polymerase specialized sigma24 family protein